MVSQPSSNDFNTMHNESVFSSLKMIQTKKLKQKIKSITLSQHKFSFDLDQKLPSKTLYQTNQPSTTNFFKNTSIELLKSNTSFEKKNQKGEVILRSLQNKQFLNLKVVNFEKMNLSEMDFSRFNCVNLEILNLNDNFIQHVPEEINKLVNLKEIHLENNLVHIISKNICELQFLSKVYLNWGFVEPENFFQDISIYVFKNSLFNRINFIHFYDYANHKLKQKNTNKKIVMRKFVDDKTHFKFLERLGLKFNLAGILGYAHKKPNLIKRN
jgi:Leucine-rich repeat (LRR) protein